MGREEDAAATGWLRYGEVHCGQRTRTGAKSGTSSPGQGLELGGMGWEGAEASWVVARLGHKSCQQLVYLFPVCRWLTEWEAEAGTPPHTHTHTLSMNPVRCSWYQVTTF